ncbi:lytic transglycosylase domain-containing protein [Paraflavisolibacter sp. H34]|uniref:lytic transglycosylase domain-containing protein n=1 Tax=Huijunlia imazamoxiresistens TaxID=3127457 RepID=UPI003019AEDC
MRKLSFLLAVLLVLQGTPLGAQVSFAGESLPVERGPVVFTLDKFIKRYKKQAWIDSVKQLAVEVFPILTRILAREAIPEDFKYVPVVESTLDVFALSPAGARGMWQFMPQTATAFGLRVQGGRDERSDFIKSTYSACAYLKRLYRMFGSWHLAAAAFNCGEGSLGAAIRRSGTRDYYSLVLNRETAEYLYRIVAVKHLFETDPRYGALFRSGETLVLQAADSSFSKTEVAGEGDQGFRTVYFDQDTLTLDAGGWHQPDR